VGCDQIIQQVGPPRGRLVLGVLAVPSAHLEDAAPTGTRPWAYFAKYGIAIRAGSPAVLITVPEAWRRRAAIGWGNHADGVSALRRLSCPRQLGAWNAYRAAVPRAAMPALAGLLGDVSPGQNGCAARDSNPEPAD
jgi:hypothetical protein